MMEECGLLRHVRACNNAVLPGRRQHFLIGQQRVGYVLPAFVSVLREFPEIEAGPDAVHLTDPAALPRLCRELADQGLLRWRAEAFDVRARPDGPVLAQIDRGAIPAFGVEALGVHVNGLVERADGPWLWVARRARTKSLDPGKLDHIVAGGVPAGLSPEQTLIKEAAEEAAIPAEVAAGAILVGTVRYAMERPEGLRRDVLYCYDLALPEDFVPRAADGEVESFELWPLGRVLDAVRDTEGFKFNVNLVLIDLFIRRKMIAGQDVVGLRAALIPAPTPS